MKAIVVLFAVLAVASASYIPEFDFFGIEVDLTKIKKCAEEQFTNTIENIKERVEEITQQTTELQTEARELLKNVVKQLETLKQKVGDKIKDLKIFNVKANIEIIKDIVTNDLKPLMETMKNVAKQLEGPTRELAKEVLKSMQDLQNLIVNNISNFSACVRS